MHVMRKSLAAIIALSFGLQVYLNWEARAFAWALPQTRDLKGAVTSDKGGPIADAICTLSSRAIPEQGVSVKTGEKGEFDFPGLTPGTYTLTCAAVGHQTVAREGLEVTEAPPPFVEVVLPATIIVREKVEVREQAPTISQQSSAAPAKLTSQQLQTLPLVDKTFKAALPLVPGVVRTPDGKINIKGTVENQGMLLVDSAETVDPVTGSFSIRIPIDAVESLEVYKTAYRAEYGRFSGGLTSIQTKPPSSQWHFELNDLVPTPRIKAGHFVGLADDSPRLSFTGPLLAGKINFSESFIYELKKQPVRGLAYPHNETKSQGFNSFTNFQVFFSSQHVLTASANLFPQRRQFVDINSLVPQSASSDYSQRGVSVGILDRYLLDSGGVFTTLARATTFSSNAHGQGPEDMLVTPNGWGGNFFNAWSRTSNQQEVLQNFQFPGKEWKGHHDLKVGGDFVHRFYDGTSRSYPVLLTRPDGTLAERIDFTGGGSKPMGPGKSSLSAEDIEAAGFFQDHWAFNDRLAMDAGVRYSGQSIGESAAFAPRVGFVYSPGSDGKTIFRSGVGVFYDRLPLLAGDFTHNPSRVITLFDAQGVPKGPPVTFRNVYVRVDDKGRHIIPPGRDLESTPYNLTWNLEMNREIRPHVIVRLNFLSSRTYNEFVINPGPSPPSSAILLLTNTGGVRYSEFESTVRFRPSEHADMRVSYVWSLARGDLNTLAQVYVPFEQPVIRPNVYSNLPSNIPHRVVAWGQFKIPWKITASPLVDVHSGFPYSRVDVLQDYVGTANGQRFPAFFSLDIKLSKDFHIPFIPWLKNRRLRGALGIYNITNHSNPRDVFANVASPFFGQFVGFQHRIYDTFLDIIY